MKRIPISAMSAIALVVFFAISAVVQQSLPPKGLDFRPDLKTQSIGLGSFPFVQANTCVPAGYSENKPDTGNFAVSMRAPEIVGQGLIYSDYAKCKKAKGEVPAEWLYRY